MMDEETVAASGQTDKKINATKSKRKIVPVKEKAGKAAASAKMANNEAEATKKVNEAEPAKKTKDKQAAVLSKAKVKTIQDLVCEAIEVLGTVEDFHPKLDRGVSRKGVSVQAIKKYVTSQKDTESSNLNTLINKALAKGIEKGTLVRPLASKDATGAVGYFRLAKVLKPKHTTKPVKRPKIDSEHASDSETIEKPVKSRKRNLSDTYIAEMKASLTSTPKPSMKQAAAAIKDIKKTKKDSKKDSDVRQDILDTTIVIKKEKGKSTKSYSSDTEVDFKKSTMAAKKPAKKTESDKPKAEGSSNVTKRKTKKLYKSPEDKKKITKTKAEKTKSEKTKAKKQ